MDLTSNVNRNNTSTKIDAAYLDIPWALPTNPKISSKNNGSRRNRRLQINDATKVLYNPVLCFKEGDVVFFQVDAQTRNFPQYYKDSILNTNKEFDYGPFEDLADLVLNQNVTVTNFAYVFKQKGIYVFDNYSSEKQTVISVVYGNQTCSNTINGVGASMITE